MRAVGEVLLKMILPTSNNRNSANPYCFCPERPDVRQLSQVAGLDPLLAQAGSKMVCSMPKGECMFSEDIPPVVGLRRMLQQLGKGWTRRVL